ncbi:transcription termination factor MTERF5, chloroplastic-like [Corylus avellana]|uniref:transcription termination factor MTERF5, chloroplastic-like n=1 Tax=Corylus avellana TaxID=13451 RepID=UPI001E225B29|nr:transcription termination factor MTERF5, chloroplastic-like [Corylus avellana]
MLRLICIKLPQELKHKASSLTHGHFFSTSSVKPIAELPNSKNPQSLTVSLLQNSCGLSLESAISASKKLNIENPKNPNSVLDLLRTHGLTRTHIRNLISSRPLLLLADLENTLKPNMELFESLGFSSASLGKMLNKYPHVLESDAYTVVDFFRAHGFSDEQISTLTMKRPRLYLYDADKNFKPKLKFFKSLGLSVPEIANLLSTEPAILERSLEKQIIPCVQELRRILGTDENVLKAIKADYRVIVANVEKVLKPNMSMLISHGVPQSLALKLFLFGSRSLHMSTFRFSEIISEVMKLGFDPNNLLFVIAIRSMAMSKTLWEQKMKAYRSFGLSEDEIFSAFKSQPFFLSVSEKKIKKSMSFFVNKLKMKPSLISKNPNILLFSLEKRIIPRCSVLQLLISKRLIKENTSIFHAIAMPENKFVEKLVTKYQNEVPDVVRAHQGNMEFQGFSIDLKM